MPVHHNHHKFGVINQVIIIRIHSLKDLINLLLRHCASESLLDFIDREVARLICVKSAELFFQLLMLFLRKPNSSNKESQNFDLQTFLHVESSETMHTLIMDLFIWLLRFVLFQRIEEWHSQDLLNTWPLLIVFS